MRTTIDLPDGVLRRARVAAAERGLSLEELIIQGLQFALGETDGSQGLPKLPTEGRKTYDLSAAEIDSLIWESLIE